ncbi:MBL fold metallo-hydrolase [Chryseobacterium limigenitum]|uniref:Metallo-beta-lactamase superfamily protein n=1 Tax=Chryseobacterium limigenitum TaxID=1612149 RepID=A0A1K2IH09_9FLAO|nr:MBL fold metallo-hydrolase [Chryseobacterium limigenitum]SFZ91582.1 Metallo-beta-lactamase superfamily protein [Chryseobacterium limigenitum]
MYNIHLLPALFGDAILIEYGTPKEPHYILIDGGPYYGYEKMIAGLKKVAPKMKEIELLIITHIDIDHIDGIVTFLNSSPLPYKVKEVWFNGFEQLNKKDIMESLLGVLQGEYLSHLIIKNKLSHNSVFSGNAIAVRDTAQLPQITLAGGFEITLLAPSVKALRELCLDWKKELKKINEKGTIEKQLKNDTRYDEPVSLPANILGGGADKSVANNSSIAFIGKYKDKSCLFAGDSPSAALLSGIKLLKSQSDKLKLDAWKLAHHGSKRSTDKSIINEIKAKHILVSTNGDRYHLPHEECIRSVIEGNAPCNIYFNYTSEYNSLWRTEEIQEEMKFKSHYPTTTDSGISVEL